MLSTILTQVLTAAIYINMTEAQGCCGNRFGVSQSDILRCSVKDNSKQAIGQASYSEHLELRLFCQEELSRSTRVKCLMEASQAENDLAIKEKPCIMLHHSCRNFFLEI